jgi:hypothetical protein
MQQETIMNPTDNFNYLNNIACNAAVHLEIITPTSSIRLKTRLIGVDPSMSVILAMRNDDDWCAARNYMREGQAAIVRLINLETPEANIIAFRTNIQKLLSIAGNWLVMDYPRELQQTALRRHSRIAIQTPCSIINKESKKVVSEGLLVDISIHGSAFIGKLLPGSTVDSQYDLQVKWDAEKSLLTTPVTVKNFLTQKDHPEKQRYGLVFEKDGQETQDLIQKIILNHLSHSPSLNMAVNNG